MLVEVIVVVRRGHAFAERVSVLDITLLMMEVVINDAIAGVR